MPAQYIDTAGRADSGLVDSRPVFFFDIDNCLYSRSNNIHDLMQELINKFFSNHLSLSVDDASMLQRKYYTEYGLAIEGLTRFHKIDPLVFNREVDDALPLETILSPDAELCRLLEDFDTSKAKPWLFTNAYVNHGEKVVSLLGIDHFFEGITFCDYSAPKLICKPQPEMYEKAEREANAPSSSQCYFVDDSAMNCKFAKARGWTAAHLVEPEITSPENPASNYEITSLQELRQLFPQFFKSTNGTIVQ